MGSDKLLTRTGWRDMSQEAVEATEALASAVVKGRSPISKSSGVVKKVMFAG